MHFRDHEEGKLSFCCLRSSEEWIQKMCYIYTMESYSAIKKNEFMKFLGKWLELENIILSEVTNHKENTQ